jgi:hypothetical protein
VSFIEPPTNRAHTSFYVQKPQRDIGKTGYDRDVYHFVREDTNVQPTPWTRRETPFDPNGSDPSAHPSFIGVRFMKPRKDVGEKGIDEEVHGMVAANSMVKPIPNARR